MVSSYAPEISQELTESRQGPIRGSLASRTPCCEKPQGTDEPCATYNEDCDGGPIQGGGGSGRTVAFPVIA